MVGHPLDQAAGVFAVSGRILYVPIHQLAVLWAEPVVDIVGKLVGDGLFRIIGSSAHPNLSAIWIDVRLLTKSELVGRIDAETRYPESRKLTADCAVVRGAVPSFRIFLRRGKVGLDFDRTAEIVTAVGLVLGVGNLGGRSGSFIRVDVGDDLLNRIPRIASRVPVLVEIIIARHRYATLFRRVRHMRALYLLLPGLTCSILSGLCDIGPTRSEAIHVQDAVGFVAMKTDARSQPGCEIVALRRLGKLLL